MFHGRGVFGDSVTIPDPTKSRPIGYRVPVGGTWPIDATVGARQDVVGIRERTESINIPQAGYGQRTDRDVSGPLREFMSRTIPLDHARGVNVPIGPERSPIPYQGPAAPLQQRMLQKYAGVFHRPPEVGPHRYDAHHEFGPPVLGASPDGLGYLRGFRGFGALRGYR